MGRRRFGRLLKKGLVIVGKESGQKDRILTEQRNLGSFSSSLALTIETVVMEVVQISFIDRMRQCYMLQLIGGGKSVSGSGRKE
jgi:hypothetical protein